MLLCSAKVAGAARTPALHKSYQTRQDGSCFPGSWQGPLRVPSCPRLPKHPLMDVSMGQAGALSPCSTILPGKTPPPFPKQ